MVDHPLLKEKDKKKKKSISKLKKELDKIFSLYVRQKYSKQGQVRCYTCGVTKDIKEIQNGHFVSRSILSLRFDERNCRPQCVGCNIFGQGKTATFGFNLDRESPGRVAELYSESQKIVKNFPYEAKIEEYKKKLNDLQTS